MAQENKSQESRIRALELQVHTLTQAVAHMMHVTKPLIELAEQAQQHYEAADKEVKIHILQG